MKEARVYVEQQCTDRFEGILRKGETVQAGKNETKIQIQ